MKISSTICFEFNKRLYVLDCGVPHPNLHRLNSRSSPDSYINSSSHTMKLDQLCLWNRPIDMPSLHVYLHEKLPENTVRIRKCCSMHEVPPVATHSTFQCRMLPRIPNATFQHRGFQHSNMEISSTMVPQQFKDKHGNVNAVMIDNVHCDIPQTSAHCKALSLICIDIPLICHRLSTIFNRFTSISIDFLSILIEFHMISTDS